MTLAAPDVIAIRNDTSIATVQSDTFLVLSPGAVADFSDNPLNVTTSVGIMAERYAICFQLELIIFNHFSVLHDGSTVHDSIPLPPSLPQCGD